MAETVRLIPALVVGAALLKPAPFFEVMGRTVVAPPLPEESAVPVTPRVPVPVARRPEARGFPYAVPT